MSISTSYRIVRVSLVFFMAGLIVSGLTAFPLTTEVQALEKIVGKGSYVETVWPDMAYWISFIHRGLAETGNKYPFMFYGTDWLAFAHLVIAMAFIGPLRDPIRNIWVVEWGMIACILVVPLALICGPIRGIPFFWTIIDCSFGVLGIIPLLVAYWYINQIMRVQQLSAKGTG